MNSPNQSAFANKRWKLWDLWEGVVQLVFPNGALTLVFISNWERLIFPFWINCSCKGFQNAGGKTGWEFYILNRWAGIFCQHGQASKKSVSNGGLSVLPEAIEVHFHCRVHCSTEIRCIVREYCFSSCSFQQAHTGNSVCATFVFVSRLCGKDSTNSILFSKRTLCVYLHKKSLFQTHI